MTDKSPPLDAATDRTDDGEPTASPPAPPTSPAVTGRQAGVMVAGERISAPERTAGTSTVSLVIGIVLGLAAVSGTVWWMLTPQGAPASRISADIPPPATVAPSPSSAPPPQGEPAPGTSPPDAPADASPPLDATPGPVATTLPPGPPLPPRTGAIADEPLDMVRRRAAAGDTDAMEDLARRYVEGIGVRADASEGARWLERAAERGAPGAMFNVGVMYERGMVVAKDPAKALEWYGKASAAGVPMATHNMALMYREGDGIPADYERATELLLAASRHGMSASMYALGTMFETGSHGRKKNPIQAIVWYAMALQFQRANPATQGSDLAQRAAAKVAALQGILSDAELRQAQAMGENEYRVIIATLRGGNQAPPGKPSAEEAAAPDKSAPAAAKKPASARERLTEIQKMLLALRIYDGKVDGTMGPATRAAIREFQRMAGLSDSGEPSDELVELLREQVPVADKK